MKIIPMIIIFLASAFILPSQQNANSQNMSETKVAQIDSTGVDIPQFRRTLQEWMHAYNSDDLMTLESLCAKDAEYIS